jgi:hypothetical protein
MRKGAASITPAWWRFVLGLFFSTSRLAFDFYVAKNGCCHVLRSIAGRALAIVRYALITIS